MPFYAFIMDFKRGTYVSQVIAASEIAELGIKSKKILINEMESEEPVPLDDLKNVRGVSPSIRGKSALIDFVKTEMPNNANPKSKIQNPKSNDVS